jgi:hypothetical protein
MYKTLLDLADGCIVWPDPREALIQATKLLYMGELAEVAAKNIIWFRFLHTSLKQ